MLRLSTFLFVVILAGTLWFFNAFVGNHPFNASQRLQDQLNSGHPADQGDSFDPGALEQQTAPEPSAEDAPFQDFAYDLQFDTIAYMSCLQDSQSPQQGNNNQLEYVGDFFSIKLGSYFSRSGVRLRDFWLNKKGDVEKEIKGSSLQYQAIPRLGIVRKTNVYQGVRIIKNIENISLERMLPDLINSGKTRIRTFEDHPIETIIKQHGWIKYLDDVHSLILGYTGFSGSGNSQKNKGWIRHPTRSKAGVDFYGQLYQLRFQEVANRSFRLKLVDLKEESRPDKSRQKNWICPQELNFTIYRNANNHSIYKAQRHYDALISEHGESFRAQFPNVAAAKRASNEYAGYRVYDDEPSCAAHTEGGAALKVAQAVLGPRWNINIEDRCISPVRKTHLCYQHLDHARAESAGLQMFRWRVSYESDCHGRDRSRFCPHSVSICIRKN